MNTVITEDTKATILLCAILGKDRTEKPLSQTEYTALDKWRMAENLRPADLLQKDIANTASIASGIHYEKLEKLLNRGVQLGFSVEEWHRNGIWVISRSDKAYPVRFKTHLKDKAPPLLFGIGNSSLLQGGGVGIVGSRNVDSKGEAFTSKVANLCAENLLPVVSGGARGVDQIAMSAAIEHGGLVVGILAENLLKKSVEPYNRKAIANGQLLLLSPYHPNAHFSVEHAMGRNKLIYAMADYGLVVSADYNKGGTWTGAKEELRRENARPVFVRIEENIPSGNTKLLELGALEWPNTLDENLKLQLHNLAETRILPTAKQKKKATEITKELSLFDSSPLQETHHSSNIEKEQKSNMPIVEEIVEEKVAPIANVSTNTTTVTDYKPTMYQVALPLILTELDSPKEPKVLAEILEVNTAQLNVWLKMAVDDKVIKKLSKPVRYQKNTSIKQTFMWQ